jgi:FkbM family methyltransferase
MASLPIPVRLKELILSIFPRLGYRLISLNHDNESSKGVGPAYLVQAALIERLKLEAPVIFDVGSNTGQAYQIYRKVFPAARIYCFEPFPESFQSLAREVARDQSVSLHPLALSSRQGWTAFNVNSNSVTNSLLATGSGANNFWGNGLLETQETIKVEQTTLDAFVSDNSIPYISVLKLDVQGSEYDVLQGAVRMLSSESIDIVYLEIILTPTYQGQHSLQDYLTIFAAHGYELVDFYNPYRNGDLLGQLDAIFVSKAVHQRVFSSAAAHIDPGLQGP